jgi:succinate dehydrogenase / fumarate reductase flavoprotein subunit
LDNRSFEVRLFLNFYAKGQTGQQLLESLLSNEPSDRSWKNKKCTTIEMLDLVVDGKARGIARNLVTGEIERHSAHAVVIASGGYGNVFFLSTNAMGSATAA